MKHVLRTAAVALLVGIAALVSGPAWADANGQFHKALMAAYGHYREALFYVHRGNAMGAAFELEAWNEKWAGVTGRYGANPPPAYKNDGKWAATLKNVTARSEKALALAVDGNAKQAEVTLRPIRVLLSELRRRNNVMLFADHVEAASAAFAALYHFRHHPPDFGDAAQVKDLEARLAKTLAAYEIVRDKAPAHVAADEQFQRLLEDSFYYLKRIRVAIAEKNQLNVVNILRRVVSSDDILWLRFG